MGNTLFLSRSLSRAADEILVLYVYNELTFLMMNWCGGISEQGISVLLHHQRHIAGLFYNSLGYCIDMDVPRSPLFAAAVVWGSHLCARTRSSNALGCWYRWRR